MSIMLKMLHENMLRKVDKRRSKLLSILYGPRLGEG